LAVIRPKLEIFHTGSPSSPILVKSQGKCLSNVAGCFKLSWTPVPFWMR
jgi:hypothetical protein